MGTVVVDQVLDALWAALLMLAVAAGSVVVFAGQALHVIEDAARRLS